MIIMYVGMAHVKGTNKETGRAYDYYKMHYIKDNSHMIGGRESVIKNVNPDRCKGFSESLLTGQYYDAQFDDNGSIISLSPAKS